MFHLVRKRVLDLTKRAAVKTISKSGRTYTNLQHGSQHVLSRNTGCIMANHHFNNSISRTLCLLPHLMQKDTDNSSSSSQLRSENSSPPRPDATPVGDAQAEEQSVGIFQRFKSAYREHGKVLIGVHLLTSSVWFGTFYYAAASGLDVAPLLEMMGVSEKVIHYVHSSVGNIATAYVMYKLATPARYTLTVFGTYSSVKYLRRWGYMPAPPEGDSIRELMKDSRTQMKERYGDLKDDVKDKIGEIQEKRRDTKDKKGS